MYPAQWIMDLTDAQLAELEKDTNHFAHAELVLEAIYRAAHPRS